MSPHRVLAMALSISCGVLAHTTSARAGEPSAAPPGSPSSATTQTPRAFWRADFDGLTETKLKQIAAAWDILKKKLPLVQSQSVIMTRAAAGKMSPKPEDFLSLYRGQLDLAKLEAEIGMGWDAFTRDQSLVLVVYSHLEHEKEIRKVKDEAAAHYVELKKLAEDPTVPEVERQAMKQQLALFEKETNELDSSGVDVGEATVKLVSRYRAQAKAWIDWMGERDRKAGPPFGTPGQVQTVAPARR